MRIISGFLKGKTINFVKNFKTRPLKDSVKESLFNILKHSNLINIKIEKSYVLDLYSGVGSFGIECISRGANEVFFVEKDVSAIKILKENLNKLSILEKAKLFNYDVRYFLNKNNKKKFHIFFFDPPFIDKEFINNLDSIKKNKLFEKNHIIIIHREKKSEDNFDKIINIIDVKFYGRSKIIFGTFKINSLL